MSQVSARGRRVARILAVVVALGAVMASGEDDGGTTTTAEFEFGPSDTEPEPTVAPPATTSPPATTRPPATTAPPGAAQPDVFALPPLALRAVPVTDVDLTAESDVPPGVVDQVTIETTTPKVGGGSYGAGGAGQKTAVRAGGPIDPLQRIAGYWLKLNVAEVGGPDGVRGVVRQGDGILAMHKTDADSIGVRLPPGAPPGEYDVVVAAEPDGAVVGSLTVVDSDRRRLQRLSDTRWEYLGYRDVDSVELHVYEPDTIGGRSAFVHRQTVVIELSDFGAGVVDFSGDAGGLCLVTMEPGDAGDAARDREELRSTCG